MTPELEMFHQEMPSVANTGADGGPIELTILMPCLNEVETLDSCIGKAADYLARSGVRGEILIADNGSTDGSIEVAETLSARIVHVTSRGYGAALIAGIKAARGEFIIMGDSDDSYDFSRLDGFVEGLRGGADMVIGNRFAGGVAPGAMPALHRYLGNPVLSFLGRLLFRSRIGDFHCGLRGFRREAALSLRLQSTGMEFASEMIVKATLMDLKLGEVPVYLSPDGRSRPPHLRSWRDGWRHLKLLLAFAPHWLFFYPGIALFLSGNFIVLLLASGPVRLGSVQLDVASLILGLAASLSGAQLLVFYGLAQLQAVKTGLLPESPQFRRVRDAITIDRASLIGGAMLFLGAASAGSAVYQWVQKGLGDLDPSLIVRPAALAVLGLALGVQIITSAFLWEILDRRG